MAILYRFLLIVARVYLGAIQCGIQGDATMKKIMWMVMAVSTLFSATPEQVERYLLVSGSEDQLIQFEQMIDGMGKAFGGNGMPLMEDSQLAPIRFREYLQRHVSEDEMQEILGNYHHDVLRKLIRAEVLLSEPETVETYQLFLKQIQTDPLPKNRTEAVRSIVKKLYDEKMLIEFFEKMFLPMVAKTAQIMKKPITDKKAKSIGKSFVKNMQEHNYNALLFMTRDFSNEEMEELDEVVGNSATSHETRAVFGAIVYAMEEAMTNMAERLSHLARQRKHRQSHDRNASQEANASR
jgi:hypothetical protein